MAQKDNKKENPYPPCESRKELNERDACDKRAFITADEASKYLWKAVNEQLRGATEQLREDVVQETIFRYIRARRHKGEPTDQFIPALLSKYLRFTSIDFLNKEIRPARKTQSLDSSCYNEENFKQRLVDTQTPSVESQAMMSILNKEMRNRIKSKDPITRKILEKLFIDGESNTSVIARECKVSRYIVTKTKYQHVKEMRDWLKTQWFDD